jgi:hypothetical protein
LSTAELNGSDRAASVADPLAHVIAELEGLRAPLRARREQLKAELAELSAREKSIAQAIGALHGGQHVSSPAPKAVKAPAKWTPSEERLKSLFELFVAEGEPISPTQLAAKAEGLGVETASKGAKILRDRELLRVAGALRGGGSLYAVMPGAEWPA